MSNTIDKALEQLQTAIGEFEGLLKSTLESGGERASETAERLQSALGGARQRLADVEASLGRDLKREWRSADRYVRDNAWLAIGVTAVAAFLLGVLTAERRE
jgi:ElaB/YqjD/DUF883 family membrane-anchored ribosome-binding protein